MSVVEFLQDILRIESRSGEEATLAARVVLEMQHLGFDAAWIDPSGNALGLVRGVERGAGTMLLTHLDHIDVGDLSLWAHPPFAGVLEGGVVHGRGAVDIKGPLAAQVYTLAALLERGERPRRDVLIAMPTLEETGGAGMAALMRAMNETNTLETPVGPVQVGACVVGEPSGNRVMNGHRGISRSTVSFHGRAHHASLGLKHDNPHFALAHFLTRLERFEPRTHALLGASTLTPTVIHADTASKNLTPNRIDLTVDWRTTTEDGAEVKSTLETLLEGLPATFVSYDDWHGGADGIKQPGFITPLEHPLVVALQAAVSSAIPGTPEPGIWRFATDGRHSHAKGIATVGFGPGREDLAHTTEEHIALTDLEAHIGALGAFLLEHAADFGTRHV
jgi:acetylornithine deacetylase/succinyl-diaminopimelate desuccinylase-like protein